MSEKFVYWFLEEYSTTHHEGFDVAEDAWNHQQKKIDMLERKLNKILDYLDSKTEETWKKWKDKADMMDQGASNAYEDACWFVKNISESNIENTIEEKE